MTTTSETGAGWVRGVVAAAESVRTRLMDARPVRSHAALTVAAPPDVVYDQWWALAMPPEAAVVEPETGRAAGGPQRPPRLEGLVDRDVEVLEDVPGETLQWRSMGRAPALALGRLTLRPAPGDRGTEVRVELSTAMPPAPVALVLRRQRPERQLGQGLRAFKAAVEAGGLVPVDGQPHGWRSLSQQARHRAVRSALGGDWA